MIWYGLCNWAIQILSLMQRVKLRLSALNSTKTAFASFVCEKEPFFEAYSFNVRREIRSSSSSTAGDRFYCQILLKVNIPEALQ